MPKGTYCPLEDSCSFKRLFLDGSSAVERETRRILDIPFILHCTDLLWRQQNDTDISLTCFTCSVPQGTSSRSFTVFQNCQNLKGKSSTGLGSLSSCCVPWVR